MDDRWPNCRHKISFRQVNALTGAFESNLHFQGVAHVDQERTTGGPARVLTTASPSARAAKRGLVNEDQSIILRTYIDRFLQRLVRPIYI